MSSRICRAFSLLNCGGAGIRTPGGLAPSHAFEACSLGHSDTPPPRRVPDGRGARRRGSPFGRIMAMSTHIGAEPGDIAERVLMPGDPLRAKWIAETYLKDARCYSTVRNMLGFTGTDDGVDVSVQGTGMGMPPCSVYAHQVINGCGVRPLIRVGSCGAITGSLKLRDVIAASGS